MGGRPPAKGEPRTGDLFAHFGVSGAAPRPSPAVALEVAAPPSVACPVCGWRCLKSPCPVCGREVELPAAHAAPEASRGPRR